MNELTWRPKPKALSMLLVIDANILFSALIKNSVTAELIFEEDLKLYTAEFIIEEFLKCQKRQGDHRLQTGDMLASLTPAAF